MLSIYGEPLDRLRVRLNMYLVKYKTCSSKHVYKYRAHTSFW